MDTLCLPARLQSLAAFRGFVERKLAEGNIAKASFAKVDLVLEEVLANIIHYAYPSGQGDAELGCELRGDVLHLAFSDRGSPFNPLASPAPSLDGDIESRTVGGLGIYFVREMVDDISYERRNGRNLLTMSMKISR